jgi:hypothetical protein
MAACSWLCFQSPRFRRSMLFVAPCGCQGGPHESRTPSRSNKARGLAAVIRAVDYIITTPCVIVCQGGVVA